jgi:hypothetical protein
LLFPIGIGAHLKGGCAWSICSIHKLVVRGHRRLQENEFQNSTVSR